MQLIDEAVDEFVCVVLFFSQKATSDGTHGLFDAARIDRRLVACGVCCRHQIRFHLSVFYISAIKEGIKVFENHLENLYSDSFLIVSC